MSEYYKFENTPLPYSHRALEPYIDARTMELHHDKHLQAYIDNLNNILSENPRYQELSLTQLLYNADKLPRNIRTDVKNNAGGVYNHQFFFNGMKNSEVKVPTGTLAKSIDKTYGSFSEFKEEFKKEALGVFGSGYTWLVVGRNYKLKIINTLNQDTPIPQNLSPILNLDVWEHAFYLKHYNRRADYIDDWFNVINWERANGNYLKC